MMDIVGILIPFFMSLAVALIAIWLQRWLSDRKEFHKILKNLLFEINENIEIATGLLPMISENIEVAKKEKKETAFPMVPFYDLAWISARNSGQFDRIPRPVLRELLHVYFDIHVMNNMIRTREQLKISPLYITPEYPEIHVHFLETIEDFTSNALLTHLKLTKGVLDKYVKQITDC